MMSGNSNEAKSFDSRHNAESEYKDGKGKGDFSRHLYCLNSII